MSEVPNEFTPPSQRLLPIQSFLAAVILIVISYLFFSGEIYKMYASMLFLFYAVTQKMWISVILLGVFQTLILIPLRIIRVVRSDNIKEFQERIFKETQSGNQKLLHENFTRGNTFFLFYLTDFFVQLATFLTIGRLFLTDFYARQISPDRLYSFVPYPDYPIQDTIFKIPYMAVTKTIDLGWFWVLFLICLVILIQFSIALVKHLTHRESKNPVKEANKYTIAYLVIFTIFAIFLVKNFPIGWEPRLFTGDVSIPNRTLNTITAVATFSTMLYFGAQRIIRKGNLARKRGVDERIIDKTQQRMFSQSVFDSTVVGLGAYFITNHIPSAFELSIFTLEVISLIAPFTLDRFILKLKRND